jgi:hypothetical protein
VCSCRFDAEMQQLQEALRQEKTGKEKALRERDMATAEKTSAEQNLAVCCFTCIAFPQPEPPSNPLSQVISDAGVYTNLSIEGWKIFVIILWRFVSKYVENQVFQYFLDSHLQKFSCTLISKRVNFYYFPLL